MEGKDGAWRVSIQIRKPDLHAIIGVWSAPLLFALLTVLGTLQLLDVLDVVYYPMIHGATSTVRFDLGLSFVPPLIFFLLIWISWMVWKRRFFVLPFPVVAIVLYPFTSLEAVVSAGSLLAVVGGLWADRKIGRYLAGVLVLLGSIEALALLHWVVFLPIGLSSPFLWYANLEMGLFYLLAHLAPFLSIPLMFLWVPKLIVHWRWGRNVNNVSLSWIANNKESRWSKFLLVFSIILGVVAAIYPYLPSVNPRNRNVGVDFDHYVEKGKLVEKDLSQVFKFWGSSRPFIYLVIYGFQTIFGLDVVSAVKYLPVILNPLLAISIYFLARELFMDNWIASWSSFFTVCGIQVAVGMFSFFLTNMLALSIVFLSLGFLFRAIRCRCFFSLIIASLIGILIVFTHPWTFDQYFATIFLTAFFILYDDRKEDKGYDRFKMMLFYLFFLALSEIVKIKVFQGYGGVSASSRAIGELVYISRFWSSTIFSFRRMYCGLESNVILLILSIVGIFIFGQIFTPKVCLIIILIVSFLPYLLNNEIIKSRLIYNIPIGLYTAYSFVWLNNQIKIGDFKLYLNLYILFNMIVYLFRSLANII
jgi:hypothetical protein